jgi:predicted RNA-binding Zn-ribbon protein involved in translation (DUF1610 family)
MSEPASASKENPEATARQAEAPEVRRLPRPLTPLKTATSGHAPVDNAEKVICERCGQAEMYRMHAVWRCPSCGFKTDCCGW